MKIRKQETNLEPLAEEKKLFPAGKHKMVLKGARLRPHKTHEGNMINLWFEGVEGSSKGLAIYKLLAAPSLKEHMGKWYVFSEKNLKALAQAVGIIEGFDMDSDDGIIFQLDQIIDHPFIGSTEIKFNEYTQTDEAQFKFDSYSRA